MATTSVYYPQVNFDFDNDPDPVLRRRKNIKSARRVLMPARKWMMPGFPKYNEYGQCCVTGVQLTGLGPDAFTKPLLDSDTLTPVDDGRTLFTEFFSDGMTGKPKSFVALMGVDTGAPLRSSYCPELLQLYWLFSQWKLQEEDDDMNERSSFLWRKKRIKMVPKQIDTSSKITPNIVQDLEPFFQKCLEYEGRGVSINQYQNPLTGEVDLTTISLDLRVMRMAENAVGLTDSTLSEG
jgi:hypothetical protein